MKYLQTILKNHFVFMPIVFFKLSSFPQCLLRLFQTKTASDYSWVFFGNVASRGLGLISFIILTRSIGPEQYGIFTIAISVLNMAIEISDLGINASTIRHGAQYAAQKDWKRLSILYSIVIRSRLIISLLVFCVGIIIAKPIAGLVFKNTELTPYIMLAFGGVFGALLNGAFISMLQASQQFNKAVIVNVVNGSASLAGVVILWWTGHLTSFSALIVYLIAPLMAIATAYIMIPKHQLTLRLWDDTIAHQFYRFGKWMALWAIATVVQNYANIFILSNMTDPSQVGYFNAAYRIALLVQMMSIAYSTVLNPKFSALDNKIHQLRHEFLKTLKVTIAMSGLIVLSIFVVPWFLPFLTGNNFSASIPVLQVLLVGMVFFTMNLPFSSVIYARGKSHIFAFASVGGLVISILSNILLIPRFKAVGPAIAFTIVAVYVLILCSTVASFLLKEPEKSGSATQ